MSRASRVNDLERELAAIDATVDLLAGQGAGGAEQALELIVGLYQVAEQHHDRNDPEGEFQVAQRILRAGELVMRVAPHRLPPGTAEALQGLRIDAEVLARPPQP